jgi:hypothetical protein
MSTSGVVGFKLQPQLCGWRPENPSLWLVEVSNCCSLSATDSPANAAHPLADGTPQLLQVASRDPAPNSHDVVSTTFPHGLRAPLAIHPTILSHNADNGYRQHTREPEYVGSRFSSSWLQPF